MAVLGADAEAAMSVSDVEGSTLLLFLAIWLGEARDAEAARFCPAAGAKESVLCEVTSAAGAAVCGVEVLRTGTEDAGGGLAARRGTAGVELLGLSWLIG